MHNLCPKQGQSVIHQLQGRRLTVAIFLWMYTHARKPRNMQARAQSPASRVSLLEPLRARIHHFCTHCSNGKPGLVFKVIYTGG